MENWQNNAIENYKKEGGEVPDWELEPIGTEQKENSEKVEGNIVMNSETVEGKYSEGWERIWGDKNRVPGADLGNTPEGASIPVINETPPDNSSERQKSDLVEINKLKTEISDLNGKVTSGVDLEISSGNAVEKRAEAKQLQVELEDARKLFALTEKNDPKYAEIQKTYQAKTEAMKGFVYEAKKETLLKRGLSEADVEKELNKYTQEILAPNFAVAEAAKIQDEKADETMIEKVKDSKVSQMIYGAVEKYRKLTFKQKILISAGLIGGAAVAGVAGGTAGVLIGSGVAITKFAQRILGGAGTAVGFEAMMQKSQQKWMTKEGWGRNRKEYIANEIHRLRAGVRGGEVRAESLEGMSGLEDVVKVLEERQELENKFEKRRTILAGIGGVAVGSGEALQAVKQYGEWTGANNLIFSMINKIPGVETIKGLFGGVKEQHVATVSLAPERIITPVAIGVRGPEGALIDNFKAHPEIAKTFGWDGKSKISEWAGAKAGELWNNDAKEALKNPKILEQMEKLGFSKDADGYAKMAHRIGKGFIQIDQTGKSIKFTDMEYLKNSTKELKALLDSDTYGSGNTKPITDYLNEGLTPEQKSPFSEVASKESLPNTPKVDVENIVTKTEAVQGGVVDTTGVEAVVRGSTGKEFLSKDYFSKMKWSSTGSSFDLEMLGATNSNLNQELASYNKLLTAGKIEEAGKHLSAIHVLVDMADKEFGVGVIDHSKIPGMK